TIKDAEYPVRPLPDHCGIDHPPKIVRAKFLFRRVNAHVIVVRLEGGPAGAAHAQVEFTGNGKNAVAQRFCFEPARREAPEQAVTGIDLDRRSSRRKEALTLVV